MDINELFSQEGQSIRAFRKGDIITRIQPMRAMREEYNDNLGTTTEVLAHEDGSYIGCPKEFIDIENGVIYLREIKKSTSSSKPYIYKLRADQWSEGWRKFIIPEGLTMDDCL